jgi:glycosyltransferase involved in cell wall biosynthesis
MPVPTTMKVIEKDPGNQLVSVIIPCYNHGKYIEEAINSILDQTYKNVETLIVDDGSTEDYTRRILPELGKKYPVKVIMNSNRGVSAARNTAIAEAAGEYILPLDADDTFEPLFIEKTLPVLLSDEKVLAVSSWARKFGYSKGIIELKGGSLRDFILDCPLMPASIFRKSDWNRIGGYDEAMKKGYEDWEFWQRMLGEGGSITVIPEPLLNYRTHYFSHAVRAGENRYEIMEYMVKKNADFYRKFPVEAVLCSERLVKENREKYRKQLDSVYHSWSYRLGHALLSPLRIFKGGNTS